MTLNTEVRRHSSPSNHPGDPVPVSVSVSRALGLFPGRHLAGWRGYSEMFCAPLWEMFIIPPHDLL